jgi:hypothetical protein
VPDRTLTIRTPVSASGTVATDSTRASAETVALLRIRRYELLRQSCHVGPERLLLRRRSEMWVGASSAA